MGELLGGLGGAVEKGLAEALADDEADAGHDAGAERVEEDKAEVGRAGEEEVLHAGAT